jgi:Putative serine esterase (DUF676)
VVHIIFLQHGFQGSAFDMRLLKNHLRLLAPGAVIVTAESNQEHPNASLREMGENLAHEVRRVVHAKCPQLAAKPGAVQLSGVLPVTCKLSFAGHSAGAVIIRYSAAAVTVLLLAVACYAVDSCYRCSTKTGVSLMCSDIACYQL